MKTAISNLTRFSLPLFFLLLPVFVLPFTYDVIEINKSVLIVFFALFWLVLLAVKNFGNKQLNIASSYLLVPTFLLMVAYSLSSVFTISTTYTLWGFYGFLSNSLPIILMLLALPIIISSLVSEKRELSLVWPFLTGGLAFVVILSLISYFRIVPQNGLLIFLSNIVVNTAGGFIVLKYVLMLASFVSSSGFVASSKKALMQVYYVVVLMFSLVLAVLVMPLPVLVACFVLAAVPFFLFRSLVHKQSLITLGAAILVVLAVAAFNFIPGLKESAGLDKPIPNSVNLSFRDSWSVTNSVIGQKVAFGSGPATFVYNYAVFKPVRMNATDLWDTLFVKPSSLYLLVLAEVGLVGFAAFMFYVFKLGWGVFTSIKRNKEFKLENNVELVSLYILAGIFLLFFLTTPGNAFVLGTFFGVVGLILAYQKVNGIGGVSDVVINLSGVFSSEKRTSSLLAEKSTKNVSYLHLIFAFLVALLIGVYGYFLGKVYLADVYAASYFNRPANLIDLRDDFVKAAQVHPRNDFYQRTIIGVNNRIAGALLNPQDPDSLSEEDVQRILANTQQLLSESARRADFITTGTDLGINVKNWEARGQLWQGTIGLTQGAEVNALQSYNAALTINQNNPRLVASIGTIYYATERFEQAAQAFERSVLLKADYAAARYNLSRTYEQLGRNTEALAVARTILAIVPEGSPDYQIVEEYVALLEEKVQADQAAAEQERLQLEQENQPTSQAPITEPDQTPAENAQQGVQTPPQPPQVDENGNPINPQTGETNNVQEQGENTLPPGQEFNTQPGTGFVENPDAGATPVPSPVVSPAQGADQEIQP